MCIYIVKDIFAWSFLGPKIFGTGPNGFELSQIFVAWAKAFLVYLTMNRNEKSELVYVWGEILLRNMVFAHH